MEFCVYDDQTNEKIKRNTTTGPIKSRKEAVDE